MNKLSFLKKAVLSLAVAATVLGTGSAYAAQIDYNNPNNQPIQKPVFNTYTNVPAGIGNEADFVNLRKSNGDPTVPAATNNFIDPVNAACAVGEKFDIRTYVHNGANTEYNNNGSGTAVAHNVNVAMQAQLGVTKKNFVFTSTISASNAASVTDTGKLNCASDVRLKLVPQTVKVYSKFTGFSSAPDSAVNGNLKVGSRTAGSGDQWGCWEDRIMVVYVVEVVEAPKPVTPSAVCNLLTVENLGGLKYKYTLSATGKNGATFVNAGYNFGDNTTATTGLTTEHTYAADGTYTTTATPVFTANGANVPVPANEKCKVTIKTTIPKENCPIPGKEQFPVGSKECQETPVTPPVTEIPSTGAGSAVTGLIGTSSIAYGAFSLFQKRRALKNLK